MVNEYLISFTAGVDELKASMPTKLKDLIKNSELIPKGMQFVSEVFPYRLTMLDDDSFMFRQKAMKNGKEIDNFRIVKLEVLFDSFTLTIVLDRYQDPNDYINSFSYDYQANTLILMHVIKLANESKRKLRLYNIETGREFFFQQIKNINLIGRIKTQIYILLDGHIYYKNKVCKIRYDLMKRNSGSIEEDVFDYYDDILDLKKGEAVTTLFPFVSNNSHKLIYIT